MSTAGLKQQIVQAIQETDDIHLLLRIKETIDNHAMVQEPTAHYEVVRDEDVVAYTVGPQNAVMVYQILSELANEINIFSEKYPVEKSFKNSSFRFIPVWNYKIVYQIKDDYIAILRVFTTFWHPGKLKM